MSRLHEETIAMRGRMDSDDDEAPAVKPERTESITDRLTFQARFVLLFGYVNHMLAKLTCERLIALAQESNDPIQMLLYSPGGHVDSGDAILDVIRFIDASVTTIGTGWVASAGTHIFLAAPM